MAEAINDTRGGMMLAPGGLAYYAACWCNDNVEYAGPFFPFLGDKHGNQASLDTYRLFQKHMTPDYNPVPPALYAEGISIARTGGDRGDAAMYAYGCSRFCLARGDMDIMDRRDGTVAALFSPRLWTTDGLASQAGDLAFWDRSTLHGLRGVLQAGETKTGMRYLSDYTKRRLLGDHVPYPVEAWPEGDQRHLSSESALYCRIYTEGLFGIRPTGLNRFRCMPRLPDGWPRMALRSVRAFDRTFDVVVEHHGDGLRLTVSQQGKTVAEKDLNPGDSAEIQLP